MSHTKAGTNLVLREMGMAEGRMLGAIRHDVNHPESAARRVMPGRFGSSGELVVGSSGISNGCRPIEPPAALQGNPPVSEHYFSRQTCHQPQI